jgi:S-adenosylmethionine hydrolase
MMTRPIFFLTDFGLVDTYVGVVKAVMLGIAPDATIVDLTHDVPPQDARAGAFALLTAAPYLPERAVVLAVVDPGVGTDRRPIAVESGGRIFVGPDNGLLCWALAAPGATPSQVIRPDVSGSLLPLAIGRSGVVLDRPRFWLPSVSASFHGRDIFGPVAAHLAAGAALSDVGSRLESIVTIPFPHPTKRADSVRGEVIQVDRFGNLFTNLIAADLPAEPVVEIAGRKIVGLERHFQSSAPLISMIGSSGFLEIAVPNGSAALALGAGVGAPVAIAPRR